MVDAVEGVENSDCRILLTPVIATALGRLLETGGEVMLAQPTPGQCLVFDSDGFKPDVQEYGL